MGDAEVSRHKSYSIESDLSLSSIQENNEIPDKEQCEEVKDNRISCSKEVNSDKIMKIVDRNVDIFSKSACFADTRSQFVSRTLEVFKNYIQDNVTIKGLPYSANAECLSLNEREVKNNETKDALLSELGKKIQVCTSKRKECPKNYCRIHDMIMQHERHNLKRSKVNFAMPEPLVKAEFFRVNWPCQNLKDASMAVESTRVELLDAVKELKETQQKLNFAQKLMTQKPYLEALQDMGYNSY